MSSRVSVITPLFNKKKFLGDTMRSVLSQTYDNWEWIVVDDCSTDGSAAMVAGLRDPRVKLVVNTENKGANYCRNHAIGIATGEYALFLDADDVLSPGCVAARAEEARRHRGADMLVFTLAVFNYIPGDDNRTWDPVTPEPLKRFLTHDLPWQTLQPFWKLSFLRKIGGFDESFPRLQDVELHTRALLEPGVTCRIVGGRPDCFYRVDAGRINFDQLEYLQRWMRAVVQYCDKFYPLLDPKRKKWLLGTVYQAMLQLVYEERAGRIPRGSADPLRDLLFGTMVYRQASAFHRGLFALSKAVNRLPARIPGINTMIKKLIAL